MNVANNTQEIWESFSIKLKNFIRARVHNPSDTEDILQEVFLKIHKNIHTLEDQKKLPAWIYRITRNSIIDYYRKNSSSSKIEYFENNEYFDYSEKSEVRDIKDCLQSFVNNLPDKYKTAVKLSDIDGVKQKDIAKILDISLPGVKSRIQRGRAKIKDHFIECCKFETDQDGKLIGGNWPNENCEKCETCSA